jgi:hypothetical protein
MFDYFLNRKVAAQDFIALQAGNWTDASGDLGYGSALIRTSFPPSEPLQAAFPVWPGIWQGQTANRQTAGMYLEPGQ